MAPHRTHFSTTTKQRVDPLGKALREAGAAQVTANLNDVAAEIPCKIPLRPPTPPRRRAYPPPSEEAAEAPELPIVVAKNTNRSNTGISWGNLPRRGQVESSVNARSPAAFNEVKMRSVAGQISGNAHTSALAFSNPHAIGSGMASMRRSEHFAGNSTSYLTRYRGNVNDLGGRDMWLDTGNDFKTEVGMETDGMDID